MPGSGTAPLRVDLLDTAEVFNVVNTMRPLPPGKTFRALLSFQPQQRTRYLETLTLQGTRTRIRVALKVCLGLPLILQHYSICAGADFLPLL